MAIIKLEEGKEMIERYKERRGLILNENYKPEILTLSETFTKTEILELLDQDDCEKFRCYFGMDGSDNIRLIMVAVDGLNKDILNSDIIIEDGKRCPNECPPPSALNN